MIKKRITNIHFRNERGALPLGNMATNDRSDSVKVTGGRPLKGTVNVQGSKNAALPILSVLPLLHKAEIYNVPDLSDIHKMISILEYLGASCEFKKGVLYFDGRNINNREITEQFTNAMRASSLLMGPLLAKYKESNVGMPGGCVIGTRPLDIHLAGFEALGSKTFVENGEINVTSTKIEGEYALPFPSVGATQNLISASVFSSSTVTLHNIAIEPEVIELIDFLNKAGARIRFIDSKTIVIKGVKKLKNIAFSIQPDRIEAFTLLTAAMVTKGEIKLVNCNPDHLTAPIQALVNLGIEIKLGKNFIKARYREPLKGIKITTGVYPSFPTDCQQQISILMLLGEDASMIVENVFNNRFSHLDELRKMGARTFVEQNIGVINPSKLTAASVDSFDLRGSASMITAGLMASGDTIVRGMRYLHRGYEHLVEKLNYLGARISYI